MSRVGCGKADKTGVCVQFVQMTLQAKDDEFFVRRNFIGVMKRLFGDGDGKEMRGI